MLELLARLGVIHKVRPERWEEIRKRGMMTVVWLPLLVGGVLCGLGAAIVGLLASGQPIGNLLSRAAVLEFTITTLLMWLLFLVLFYGEWRYNERGRVDDR